MEVDRPGEGHPTYQNAKNICFIGAGYVGGPTAAVFADRNAKIDITVVDINTALIEAWNSDCLPIYEPGLLGIVQHARDGTSRQPNLFFSTDIDSAISMADIIFLSVNTPSKATGDGAGREPNLAFVKAAVHNIAKVARSNKIIVEKSTVPCRTAKEIKQILHERGRPGVKFEVLSNPEFLAQGNAISNLLQPDRVLIGSFPTQEGTRAAAMLAEVYMAWVSPDCIITTDIWSSELAKLAANAFLAQRISSINALSAVCEKTGADIEEVSYICGLDDRIGPKMLKSSVGFGGSCFQKDVSTLIYIAESLKLPEVAAYWKPVVDINEYQTERFIRRIVQKLEESQADKKIAILGFAYKKDTGDTRQSAAVTVAASLLNEGATIRVYDPFVKAEQIREELGLNRPDAPFQEKVRICKDAYEACADMHAVAILTEWDEFSNKIEVPREVRRTNLKGETRAQGFGKMKDDVDGSRVQIPPSPPDDNDRDICYAINKQKQASVIQGEESYELVKLQKKVDWERIKMLMRGPRFVFDGRNIIDHNELSRIGFRVEGIGKTGALPRHANPDDTNPCCRLALGTSTCIP